MTFDPQTGRRLLRDEAAQIVEDALLHFDGERYRTAAWCVMPTHVHALIELRFDHALSDILQTWKSVTSHAINKRENRKGTLWRREYFDRFMRDNDHLSATVDYVESNPVKAGLVERPEHWRWSSAHNRNC